MNEIIENLKNDFYLNFIKENRWHYIRDGLVNTLEITFFALIVGLVLGCIIGVIRSSYDKMDSKKHLSPLSRFFFSVGNTICKLYLTVIRGTPVITQLLIIYYCIFASVKIDKLVVAIIAFGLNSAAYVAEIVRSGIMSVDNGQFEAGRSLGLNYVQTLIYIVLPQTFKTILPTLANEMITLLKETSVSGYIALNDLTKGGDIIQSITYAPFMPLFGVAIIYLLIVLILQKLVNILERRLRSSDH